MRFMLIFTIVGAVFSLPAMAEVQITKDENYIYIRSDGIPNHTTGQFPNRGNPHSISEQSHVFKVPLNPVKNKASKEQRGTVGVALNGVPFEPGTAEFWNNDRNYNYEAIDGKLNLGLDQNNAHVQPTGSYHYHGVPTPLVKDGLVHIGYAADGFKIYADGKNRFKSSYRLKEGQRAGGPSGSYDGSFGTDYEYVADLSPLDKCNGAIVDGAYAYFATESYPFLPRCLYGNADSSFEKRGGGQVRGSRPPHRGGRPPPRH